MRDFFSGSEILVMLPFLCDAFPSLSHKSELAARLPTSDWSLPLLSTHGELKVFPDKTFTSPHALTSKILAEFCQGGAHTHWNFLR